MKQKNRACCRNGTQGRALCGHRTFCLVRWIQRSKTPLAAQIPSSKSVFLLWAKRPRFLTLKCLTLQSASTPITIHILADWIGDTRSREAKCLPSQIGAELFGFIPSFQATLIQKVAVICFEFAPIGMFCVRAAFTN